MRSLAVPALAAVLGLAPLASPAAQSATDGLRLVAGLDAGVAGVGRLLEQRLGDGSERELRLAPAAEVSGSVGLAFGPGTSVRVELGYSPSSLRFRDDTGGGASALDQDDLADLSRTTVALVARTGVGALSGERLSPYAVFGAALGIWTLDTSEAAAEGPRVTASDASLVRFGAVTGVGVEAAVSERLGLHVEAVTSALGNPFSGSDAFRLAGDDAETFDEPDVAAALALRAGLSARF